MCQVKLQQHKLRSQRNIRDMAWILMSLHFLRALCNSCLVKFAHFPSSGSFSLRSLPSIFIRSISLININNFWMASRASSLLVAFFPHLLHHIICNSPYLVSVFRFHTDIFYASLCLFCYDTLLLLYILRYMCVCGWLFLIE